MTLRKEFLFVFVVLAANKIAQGYAPQKLFLTVYYESLCPDSRAFILHQLRPAMKQIPNSIILHLVPFGKSRSKKPYNTFECQHGPAECRGNAVQSCALEVMQQRSDVEKVEYVACEFETYAGSRGDLSCVQKSGISVAAVNQCLDSGMGTELQLEAEYQTQLVRPKFIPTVTVNGIFDQQIQDAAQVDLVGTLCSMLKQTPQCSQHYNSMALRYVLY